MRGDAQVVRLTTHHGTAESDRMHAPPLSVTTRPEPLVTLKNGAQLQLLFFVDPARRAARLSAAPLLHPLPDTPHCQLRLVAGFTHFSETLL